MRQNIRDLWISILISSFFLLGASGFVLSQTAEKPAKDKSKKEKTDKKESKKDKPDKKERADPAELPAVLWHEPTDMASRDLFYGIGGKEHAPDPKAHYKFIEESMEGTQPKFDVEDDQGQKWRVKVGDEAQSETAATRLVWAAGYYTDEDYYLPEMKVDGLPLLKRGRKFTSPDGTVRGARLERHVKGIKTLDTWWFLENPFVATRELNGLRTLMALINNWDLPSKNTKIYDYHGKERVYLVSDLGEAFGDGPQFRGKWCNDLNLYLKSRFIKTQTPEYIDFDIHGRLPWYCIFRPGEYKEYWPMQRVGNHIPRADAKWMGQVLAKLSDAQIKDAFRSGGYTETEIEAFFKQVRSRIEVLIRL